MPPSDQPVSLDRDSSVLTARDGGAQAWVTYGIPLAYFLAVVASRGVSIYCNREINVDESLMLEQAMRFQHDGVPWRSVDGLTSGPINTWALLLAHEIGVPLSYRGAHLLAAALLGATISGTYVVARRWFGGFAAFVAATTGMVWLACNQGTDFTHYSSELVPVALLTLALGLFSLNTARPAVRFILLAGAGLALGALPWAKLQAGPIGAVLGVGWLVFTIWIRKPIDRWLQGAAVVMGALLPTAAMLTVVVSAKSAEVMWRSYFLTNLGYAGHKTIHEYVQDGTALVIFSAIGPWILVVAVGWVCVVMSRLGSWRRWLASIPREASLAWLIFFAAVWVCVRPATQFPHYSLFLVPPLILLTAALVRAGEPWSHPAEAPGSIGKHRFALCVAGWLFYAAANANAARGELLELLHLRARNGDAAAVVEKIHRFAPQARTVEIWGWFPSVYVQLQQISPTRYGIPHLLYAPATGPSRAYLRRVYMQDLSEAQPDVILKMCGAYDRRWAEDAGFFPELAEYVSAHYERRWSGVTPFYDATATIEIYVRR